MIESFDKKLKELAQLTIRVGVNLQKGQTLLIRTPVECACFARILASEAYEVGCREVLTEWTDEFMTRERYLKADNEVFDEVHVWRKDMLETMAKKKTALISIASDNPENLKGVDPERIRRMTSANGKALEEFYDLMMSNFFPWCVVSVPTLKWAQKVFPDLNDEEAVDALWSAIFKVCRVDGNGGAIKAWEKHVKLMGERAKTLNDFDFKSLHYKNSLGTDLTVELPKGHKWIACGEKASNGVNFIANIPTEEIFTLPKKDGVNGRVVSTKPLVISGSLIDDFAFELKDGKIVDISAKQGLSELKNSVTLDEGASYLGEVALVPFKSPISDLNILFYNTLFDENASCHFAYGSAYPCFKDADLSAEEMKKRGMNKSITHIDFMIGSPDLSITGIDKNGKSVEVFKNGNFTF